MELRRDHSFNPLGPDADAYDHNIPGFADVDYNDPSVFARLLGPNSKLPIPAFKAPADVRREAEERSSKLLASFKTLYEILQRHEATIQKRWSKRTRQRRLNVLAAAWPGMATVHRPDFQAFRMESEHQRDTGTRYRDKFMWPYINQEDLSGTKTLLLLLNARGRNHPSDFAAADCSAMHLGLVTKALVPIFLNSYTMVLNGVTDDQEYGKLVSWNDHPDAFDWMHTRKQFLPGECLLILEAQQRVLQFLVECCQQILHDIPIANLTTDAFPCQPEPQLKTETESVGFASLAAMAAEASYRLPSQLDLGRIESLLGAKASAAEDHLWALREDPSYFAEQLFEVKEHRQEMLKDVNGHEHPALRPGRDAVFWSGIIGNVLLEAYLDFEVFSELRQQAQDLQSLQAKYATLIQPTGDLPEEFLAALLTFRHYLTQAAKGPLNQLLHGVVASPPLRKYYVREPPIDANSTKIEVCSKPGLKMNKIEGQLTWLLRTLWEDGYSLFLIGLPLALDELERLLQAEPQAQELLSARIAGIIGNLSIVSQCLHQLDLYQPWAGGFETALLDKEDGIKEKFSEWSKPMAAMMAALDYKTLTKAVRLGDPSDKKFSYPSGKRRTKENTEALRRAERSLDDFWAAVDQVLYALEGKAVRQLLLQQRILQRTPKWVDEPTVTSTKQKMVSNVIDGNLSKPSLALSADLPNNVTENREHSISGQTQIPTRVKSKTKGTPYETLPDTTIADVEVNAEPMSFPVDSRALKVFRTLFFNPAVTSSPGEVSWNDFLHAMASTGFTAEKLYGSTWQFEKVHGLDQSRIQFHEPHPRRKIPFMMARRYGRRLNRTFGWDWKTFVLKEAH